jgi:hypothetical protein
MWLLLLSMLICCACLGGGCQSWCYAQSLLLIRLATIKSVLEAQATSHGVNPSSDAMELDKVLFA